ncbi:MAG TPA: trans-aconitate 2-methyltransferase [Pedobacter sp.]|uniref:trans-aconitate 2-methyltransferase n=1 Tax=Pedobacter sp. TaxID=1411316 RepID=UPI002C2A1524|nr:trans-aconitate 2-methyltransferase [Pedobacter sp.]HMI04144.1 trans-aconitate 2-methyltransferase [Pedobacter sp.]
MKLPEKSKADTWSAEQYTKFENERNRPVKDLLAHIPTVQIKKAIDIGCGPGNSTELLRHQYPDALISGIDSSPDMISAARKRIPGISFEVADISTWQTEAQYDIILANAALQWVPDHAHLFPGLITKLTEGGSLAVQMPDNFNEPTHRLMRTTATEGPWAKKIEYAAERVARQSPDWYYQILKPETVSLDIWRTTYYHPLAGGTNAIVEWFKATGLRPFLDPLDADEQAAYLDAYTAAIESAYPVYADGSVLLPFPRLFILATR